jgi:HTH-type transcriptional regulator, sugar sensing transcriptional regulator
MNDQQLISQIEELGLSNKEARVYVASLALGPSSVQRIADHSSIKRVTTYVILESLLGLGLVSQSTKGKKTYFNAEDPTNLHRLLEKREQELKDQRHNFDQILPKLKSLGSMPKDTSTVRFYDSTEGIMTIMNTFLDQGRQPGVDLVYGYSNLDLVFEYFPQIRANMSNPGRTKAGIRSHFLYTSKQGPIMKDGDVGKNRESRWLPPDKFPVLGDFTIVGDNVMMLSLGAQHPIGITVASRELAQGLKILFLAAWEAAAAYNK